MKHFKSYLLSGCVLFLLTGCPIGLDYPLGYKNEVENDPKYYGTWKTDDTEETILSFRMSKKTSGTMHVEVTEYDDMFSLATTIFTGWTVRLGGMDFLCFEENEVQGNFYHYVVIELNDNLLKVCDMALLHGGADAVNSQESLRKEVLSSMKKPEFLASPITYTKVR